MPVALVSDSCHYLPRQIAEACGLHEVSLYVHRGGTAQRELEISDYDDYYRRLRAEEQLPTTSQPSIGDFLAVYEPLLDAGHEIVSIHLSGGISGTVRAAEQAREQLGDDAAKVQIVDSRTACGAQGLQLMAAAAALAHAPDDAPAAAAAAIRARESMRFWFAVDTLEYLRRGGRIGGAQAWLGGALQIKPILSIDSEITPVERVRTSRRAFERLVTLADGLRQEGADAWVIQHVQAPDQAAALAARCTELFGHGPAFVSELGPVIGTHVGPGLIGVGAVPSSLLG